MADRLTYKLSLTEHGMDSEYASLFTPGTFSPWAENVRIDQHSLLKRPGYYLDRDLRVYDETGTTLENKTVYNIVLFQQTNGSRYTLYLTDTDLIRKREYGNRTWTYLTETYTTGTAVGGGTETFAGTSGTLWLTGGVAAGDWAIFDGDHSSEFEPDSDWRKVSYIPSEEFTSVDTSLSR